MKNISIALVIGLTVSLSGQGYAKPAEQPAQPAQKGEICGVIGTNAARSSKLKVMVRFGTTPEMAREKIYREFSGMPKEDVETVKEFTNACAAIALPYGRDAFGWAVEKDCNQAVAQAIKDCIKKTDSQCFRDICSCSFGITP